MPGKPGRFCPHCGGVVTGARCPCRGPVTTSHADSRLSSTQRGYGYDWQQYRKEFYKYPRPCACGCGLMATLENGDVDHRIPVQGRDDPLFWDKSNHQALIHGHHSRKTQIYDRARRGGVSNLYKSSNVDRAEWSRAHTREITDGGIK